MSVAGPQFKGSRNGDQAEVRYGQGSDCRDHRGGGRLHEVSESVAVH